MLAAVGLYGLVAYIVGTSRREIAIRLALGAVTLAALGGIVLSAYLAWRQWGFGSGDPPHDEPTRRDRVLFQGFATLLHSGLSFVAVLFVAVPLVFIEACQL